MATPDRPGQHAREAALRELRSILGRGRGIGDLTVSRLVQLAIALEVPAAELLADVIDAVREGDTDSSA